MSDARIKCTDTYRSQCGEALRKQSALRYPASWGSDLKGETGEKFLCSEGVELVEGYAVNLHCVDTTRSDSLKDRGKYSHLM